MRAVDLARMIDVLKGTWIYKLQSKEDRKAAPEFTSSSIKEVIYREENGIPSILIVTKDGARRFGHPHELSMTELEALTTWAENLRGPKKPNNPG